VNANAPTVAIVGGGALGAALVGLLTERLSPTQPWGRAKPRVVLFEKSEHVGRGLAYARDGSPYLLNTTAQTMSLVPGRRADFFQWLEQRGLAPKGEGEHFCARERFGDYVEDCFARSLEKARRRGIGVTTVRDEVAALTPRALGGYRVVTRGHAPVDADVVVLAVGNVPSNGFRELRGPGFFPSPYPSDALRTRVPPRASVAVLGTGLSAIDAALALFGAGHEGSVTMASRSGMLPRVRGPLHDHELLHVTRSSVARATDQGRRPLRWATVLRWLEQEVEHHGLEVSWDRDFPAWADAKDHLASEVGAASSGARLWQSIGEALNPMMDVLWHHLDDGDRRLFLDRYRSRFMAHWVPMPLVTARRVLGLLRDGKLEVARGLGQVTRNGEGFCLAFEDRSVEVDCVINATGTPRYLHESDSPLLEALVGQGTIAPHACGGAHVDFESFRVLGAEGRLDPSLFALGNLTCGTHLFTSTLDLNVEKADRVAAHVVEELRRRTEKDLHVDATPHTS
jgi:uncharacterized NAD(P)/FAD-binding protein YdhS